MVVGTTLFKLDGNAYYSPSFRRGGLAATFALNVTHMTGSPTVTVTIQERNEDETSWSDPGVFASITSTGAKQVDLAGPLKEVLRFKFTFDGGDDATDAVHLLMQAPSWRPY